MVRGVDIADRDGDTGGMGYMRESQSATNLSDLEIVALEEDTPADNDRHLAASYPGEVAMVCFEKE
jgi:hypothetical protein